MPDSEQQEETLSETVVKEAVGLGMESSLRDSILEAVEEADGGPKGGRNLPLAGALFGTGAAVGFLAGRQSTELEEASLEELEEPDIIEDVIEERTGEDDESTTEISTETEDESEEGGGLLGRLLLVAAAIVGIALVRRRLSGEDEADEEWEPIEKFEPVTEDEDDEAGSDEQELEAEREESDEGDAE